MTRACSWTRATPTPTSRAARRWPTSSSWQRRCTASRLPWGSTETTPTPPSTGTPSSSACSRRPQIAGSTSTSTTGRGGTHCARTPRQTGPAAAAAARAAGPVIGTGMQQPASTAARGRGASSSSPMRSLTARAQPTASSTGQQPSRRRLRQQRGASTAAQERPAAAAVAASRQVSALRVAVLGRHACPRLQRPAQRSNRQHQHWTTVGARPAACGRCHGRPAALVAWVWLQVATAHARPRRLDQLRPWMSVRPWRFCSAPTARRASATRAAGPRPSARPSRNTRRASARKRSSCLCWPVPWCDDAVCALRHGQPVWAYIMEGN